MPTAWVELHLGLELCRACLDGLSCPLGTQFLPLRWSTKLRDDRELRPKHFLLRNRKNIPGSCKVLRNGDSGRRESECCFESMNSGKL